MNTETMPPPVGIPAFRDEFDRKAWIKSELNKRGLSLAKISFKHGSGSNVAAQSLHIANVKWQERIAWELGVHAKKIWPERYDGYGIAIPQSKVPKPSFG